MEDIKAILEGFEISDDAKKTIIEKVRANYRSINEVNKKSEKIAELENRASELEQQNNALTEQIGALEGDGEELENLRKQIREFTEAEESRKKDEAERSKRSQFRVVFDAAVGDREFANDVIREAMFEKSYAKCSENTGLDAKAVLDEMTDGTDGVWKNPQNDVNKMPPANGEGESGRKPVRSLDEVKGMTSDEINKNWESIRKMLG